MKTLTELFEEIESEDEEKNIKVTYCIIHIPRKCVIEGIKTNIDKDKVVFSSKNTEPDNTEIITLSETPFKNWCRYDEECLTLNVPISETNNHQKLSKPYTIKIDLYFKKEPPLVSNFM